MCEHLVFSKDSRAFLGRGFVVVFSPCLSHQNSVLQLPGISASLNPQLCLLDTLAWGSLSLLCGLEVPPGKKARTLANFMSVSFLLGLTVLPVVHCLNKCFRMFCLVF